MSDREQQPGPGKRKKKKRPPPVYVEVRYPFRLGVVSFAWALVGGLIAAAAPHLAFAPMIGVLHLLFPAVTVGLIGANLFFAVRDLRRGAHVLRLLVVTGLQIALFTTLFYQLFAHVGAELYDVSGPTSAWQWAHFSLAHAFRAGDVFDVVEAFGMKIQPVKHDAALVAVFVILYHVVVDVFFLGLLWEVVARARRRLLKDERIADLVTRSVLIAFFGWLVVWLVVALWLYPWRKIDLPLWLLENVLRVVDFADVMESFNLRLHSLPREGIVGTLTFLCRVLIAIGIAALLSSKKRVEARRVVTPPDVDPSPYWWRRVAALAAMLVVGLLTALVGQALLGNPAPGLAAAVGEGPEARSRSALRALRRMGPAAKDSVPALVEARSKVDPAVRDEVTRTLGYLGDDAIDALRDIALSEEGSSAVVAVEALGEVGGGSAPELVKVWGEAASEDARDRADKELRRLGREAVPPMMDATTAANAEAHYSWFNELDPNWRLRNTGNAVARSLQRLPDLIERLHNNPDAEETAKLLNEIRACGSAAKEVFPEALRRLNDKDNSVRSAAAAIVVAMGPSVTPTLLKRLEDPGSVPEAAAFVGILNDPSMWNDAVLKDPATLPILLKMARRPDDGSRQLAVRHLGYYGPAAKEAVPWMVASLGSPDESARRAARESLAKVDPDWKKHPALNSAIPLLLGQLGELPREEADELFAAFGDLPEADAGALAEAVVKRIHDRDAPGVPRRGEKFDETAYKAHLDRVFAPVERLGPKLKAAVPELTRKLLFQSGADVANNQHYRVLRIRSVQALEAISPDPKLRIGVTVYALGYDDQALDYVKKHGAAALPYLSEAFKAPSAEARMFSFKAAGALGAVAKPLVPDLIALLRNANARDRAEGRDDVWMLGYIAQKLSAIDKDWWAHPEAARVLGELAGMQALKTATGEDNRAQLLALIGRAGPAGKPLAGPLAAGALAKGAIDAPLRKVLDGLDPDWRAHPALKKAVPTLVEKMKAGIDDKNEQTLTSLGAVAVPALVEALPDAKAFAQQRMFVVLQNIGPARKEAIPALVKVAADPKLPPESTRHLLDALRAIDANWAADPGRKGEATSLLAALLKRGETEPEFIRLAGKVGPAAVPELVKRLSGPKSAQRNNAVIGLGEVGPGVKDAVAGLKRVLRDPDAQTRRHAVEALGKAGQGGPDLIAVVAPALIDQAPEVRNVVPEALQRIDADWKKSPKLKEPVSQVIKALAHPDAKTRRVALAAVGQIGPAEGVVPALEKMIKQEKDAENLRLAQSLLDQLRNRGAGLK